MKAEVEAELKLKLFRTTVFRHLSAIMDKVKKTEKGRSKVCESIFEFQWLNVNKNPKQTIITIEKKLR